MTRNLIPFIFFSVAFLIACNFKRPETSVNVPATDSNITKPEIEYLTVDTTYVFDPEIFDLNRAVIYEDSGYLFVRGNRSPYWRNLDSFLTYKIEIVSGNIIDSVRSNAQDYHLQSLKSELNPQRSELTNTEAVKLTDTLYATWVVTGNTVMDVDQVEGNQPDAYVNGVPVARNEIPRYKRTVNREKSQYVGTLSILPSSSYSPLTQHQFRLTQFVSAPEFRNTDNIVNHNGYFLIETNDDSLRLFNCNGIELLKIGDNFSNDKEFNFYDFIRDSNQTFILRTRINKTMQLVQFDNSTGQILNSGTLNSQLNLQNINSFSLTNCDTNFLVSLYTQLFLIDKTTFKIKWQKNLAEIGASLEDYGKSDSWSAPVVYKNVIIQEFTVRHRDGFNTNLCVLDYKTGELLKTYPLGPHHNEFGLKIVNGYLYFIEQSYDSYYRSSNLIRIKINI